ncbi:HAD family hydrolase [Candidatus Dojkabacteria bacterium]|uniref:HAD family hydrolase n=1 Tax=Candidatus Dojkabacteria bacterium TaxID=2099670 RepID=A0A955I5Z7_9BACT|nr:HAD family hydrolase [Candidatus Dojkabacteria bacterium]
MELSTVLKKLDIQAVLFDLDDTLIATHAIFKAQVEQMMQVLVSLLVPGQATGEQLWEDYNSALSIAIQTHNVVPELLWRSVLRQLQESYPAIGEDTKEACLSTLMDIYEQVPVLFGNVIEILSDLKSAGIKVAVVTHAAPEWTEFKLEQTGILPFIDHVQIAPTGENKDWRCWYNASWLLGVPSEHCLAVGDSLRGDVEAALMARIGEVMLMRRTDGWDFVSQGDVPEGVTVIGSLGEIPANLIEKYNLELKLR